MLDDDSPLSVADRVKLLLNALADDRDPPPVVRLDIKGANAIWLITECDADQPNRLFGLADLGVGHPEIGYFHLSDLKGISGRLGLPVERDLHFVADKPLSAYAGEARRQGRIVA